VTRDRLITMLTAVLLALVGGGLVAVPVMLFLRGWLEWDEGMRALVIAAGLAVWILASAAISAAWLRRKERR
jgi:uncharacterized membrane protein YfcA